MPRPRSTRRRLLLVLLQLVVCLVLLEVGLALAEPFSYRLQLLLYRPRVEIDYGALETTEELLESTIVGHHPFHEHGGFVLNSRGFRTPEYERAREPGVARVVTLGDSFTFSCSGIPFERFWPSLVRRGLEQRSGRPVELINLGIPATGLAFYLRMWELEARRLDPDLLLVMFFVGNDFQVHEQLEPTDDEGLAWLDESRLLRLVRNVVRIRRADLLPVVSAEPLQPATPGQGGYELPGYAERYESLRPRMSDEALARREAARAWICDRGAHGAFLDALERVRELLDELQRQVAASGSRLLVVLAPDRFQVNPGDQELLAASAGQPTSAYDWDVPQRLLVAHLVQRGIPHLDLLPAFRDAPDRERLYSPGDTHWSPEGCALAARVILERLAADDPLPER